MLTIPAKLLSAIEHGRYPKDPSTPQDIALIRSIPPLPVPESYIEFVTRFGYPTLDPLDDPNEFDYEYREPELTMGFKAGVAAFMPAQLIERYYKGLVLDQDEDLPKFPAFMLPICFDAGQSHVLLECGGEKDRVWFWEFQGERWGQGNNVRLGFVADTFQDFLNKLRVPA